MPEVLQCIYATPRHDDAWTTTASVSDCNQNCL